MTGRFDVPFNEANRAPVVRSLAVPAPAEWAGRRILHLTDLHLVPGSPEAARIAAGLKGIEADLVVITGDILEHADAAPDLAIVLDAVRCTGPAFAVLGNHDLVGDRAYRFEGYHPAIVGVRHGLVRLLANLFGRLKEARPPRRPDEGERIGDAIESLGIRVLDNTAVSISGGGWILGVSDPYSGHDDLPRAISALPSGVRPLGLVHAPGPAPSMVDAGAFLVLCGHTHGQQIYLPGTDRLLRAGGSTWQPRYGVHRHGDGTIVISGGAGHLVPLRFRVPPEVWLFDLVPAAVPALVS